MQCPRDGTVLENVVVLRTILDKCHTCDGLWLDAGELERICDKHVTGVEEQLEKDFGNPVAERRPMKGFMRCPKCENARLQRIGYSYSGSKVVEIDRCESCLGLWIDKGELDAIVNAQMTKGSKPDEDEAASRLTMFIRSIGRLFG
ncbi:MAG: zf-TFIIB domain-containing protein [Planctomycetales bacterium]|nr:zf-TFIIB domain-containing protein [Planctomycetales bacterium]